MNFSPAARSIPMAIGGCAVLGAVMGTFDYSGQLTGEKGVSFEDRRKAFFKPPKEAIVDGASQ